jgi:hypothetical protein
LLDKHIRGFSMSETAWQPPALATLHVASANTDCLNNLGTLTIPPAIHRTDLALIATGGVPEQFAFLGAGGTANCTAISLSRV